MATDLSLSSAAQLFALILEENAAAVTAGLVIGDVTFGNPSVHAGANPGDTDVVVTAVANSGYSGNVTVNYDRLDLAGLSAFGAATVTVAEGASVADVVAALNVLYGTNIDPVLDVAAGLTVPDPDDDGENFTLVANANSLAYKGSLVVSVVLTAVALNTIITTTNLNGLEFPTP